MYKNVLIVSVAGLGLLLPALASDREDDIGRIEKATRVFHEIMTTPDKGIPRDLLEKAKCIAIIPGEEKARLHIRRQLRQGTGDLPHCQWLERSDVSGCRGRERRLPDWRLFHRRGDAIYERPCFAEPDG